ncbi:MAG: prepilin-type N-terminal cleavage/methylation domain-containing protein [Gemmatimonadota bacterium]|jgi:type IV pilus assembly protein PilA
MLKHREGFTLIELLIVVVIIGILAAIAIPKFSKTREKAYVSAMESDLRNLQTSEEIYYSDPANAYSYLTGVTLAPEVSNSSLAFQASSGVSIDIADNSSTTDGPGYTATATHASGIPTYCTVVVGNGAHGVRCSTT